MLVNSYQEKDQGTPLLKCLTDFEIDAKLTVLNVNAGFLHSSLAIGRGLATKIVVKCEELCTL